MDDDFAAYAWSNDQRIERLTGQRFTERIGDGFSAIASGFSTAAPPRWRSPRCR